MIDRRRMSAAVAKIQANGLRVRPEDDGGATVTCNDCGASWPVVLSKYAALPAKEIGCPPCSVNQQEK